MPRKGYIQKREIIPDPKFNDVLVGKFINYLTLDGKKSVAEKILYTALDLIKEKTGSEGIDIFKQALENAKPLIEVKPRRVGGATYQVPVEVRLDRKIALAMRWLVNYSSARSERTMQEKLAAELLDAANNRGTTVKKKEDVHKMAEANKAFAHYRW